MKLEEIENKIQIIDNLVREFSIKNIDKIQNVKEMQVTSKIGFKIVKIEKKEKSYIAQISLINDLSLVVKEQEIATIHIKMDGLFTGNLLLSKEELEEELKLKGAPILYQFIQTYIHMVTGISGMPNIVTPIIDFSKFFHKQEK